MTAAEHVRGVLRDAEEPLKVSHIVERAGIPQKLVQRALKHLMANGCADYEERPWVRGLTLRDMRYYYLT